MLLGWVALMRFLLVTLQQRATSSESLTGMEDLLPEPFTHIVLAVGRKPHVPPRDILSLGYLRVLTIWWLASPGWVIQAKERKKPMCLL